MHFTAHPKSRFKWEIDGESMFCFVKVQLAQKLIQLLEEAVLATSLDSWMQC